MNSFCYKAFIEPPAQGYYACNRYSEDAPLMINCTGQIFRDKSFASEISIARRKDFYLLFLLNGKLNIHIGHETVEVFENTVVIFPPNYTYHYEYADTSDHIRYLYVHFTGSYVNSLLLGLNLCPFPLIKNISLRSSEKLIKTFHSIFDEFKKNSRIRDYQSSNLLERLILTIADDTPTDLKSLEKSVNFIHHHYNEKISIPDLAKMEALCNSRYITLFNSHYGITPSEYIINVRISAACELLLNTDTPVSEVGRLVGYPDPCFFSKIFKANVGISPKEYRKKHQASLFSLLD